MLTLQAVTLQKLHKSFHVSFKGNNLLGCKIRSAHCWPLVSVRQNMLTLHWVAGVINVLREAQATQAIKLSAIKVAKAAPDLICVVAAHKQLAPVATHSRMGKA